MKKKTTETKKKATISSKPNFSLENLVCVNRRAIVGAQSRYSLNIDADFPSMSIKPFDEAIAGLVGGEDFHALVGDVKQEIENGWRNFSIRAPDYVGSIPKPKGVLRALDDLAASAPGRGGKAIAKIRQRAELIYKKADALSNQIYQAQEQKSRNSGHFSSYDPNHGVISYKDALWRAINFMPRGQWDMIAGKDIHMLANPCGLHQSGVLILCGEWGIGKTHSLCDLAKKHGERNLPALLVLAKDLNLDLGDSPDDVLAQRTRLADNFGGLLRRLNELGRECGVRALLLVDGINEDDPNGVWRRELGKMIKRVRGFPFVGLVVSYRVPFDCGLSESDLLETPCLKHEGFEEIPLEAQAAFLEYYGVPLPEIPPMAQEFTRPLTLKIICEIFRSLPKSEQRKGFDGTASGQKGMTRILERYIKARAHAVEKKHRRVLSKQKIWALLDEVMAPYMAKNLVERIPAALLLEAMRDRLSVSWSEARKMLRDMSKEGVVSIERGIPREWRERAGGGARSKQSRWRVLVRMPYQRFSDHFIARELLKKHLKSESARAVRGSFRADNPLTRAFTLEKGKHRFHSTSSLTGSGPAEALILEFPERVKNTPGISAEKRELLFYLPRWREKYVAYRAPFLDGLYWRANAAFSRQTSDLINGYLGNWQDLVTGKPGRSFYSSEHRVIDALLSLACRHNSPVAACRLYRWIKSMSMPDRDVVWGAAMREARVGGWTRNLFVWLSALERNGFKQMSAAVGRNYVTLLSLFLGATDRSLRDKATEALVAIGENFPAALFSHALDMLDFKDIYYPERMLAACYGVAMAQWPDPEAKEFHDAFPAFARAIVRNVFMPEGRLLTHHALVRDYALGIADIARQLGVKFNKDQEVHMSPPFPAAPSPFPPASEINEKELSLAQTAFGPSMDFYERYTIRRISPNGRYKDIARQIKWRVKDLGYTDKQFGELDRKIGHENFREADYDKEDRCGKKYSWIAYHEMCGMLDSCNELPELMGSRGMEGILDPSFPIPPPEWNPKFRTPPMDGDDLPWLAKSPAPDYGHILELEHADAAWVMLEGFAIHRSKSGQREVFSFLRGLLVRESDISCLRTALDEHAYPGNSEIPHCVEIHEVFSGEIPWSSKFTHPQEDMTGRDKAFRAVPIETTVVHNRGNGWRGERFKFSNAWFPAPDICVKLRLSRRGRSVDLVDERGRTASLYRADAGKLQPNPYAKASPADKFQFLHLRKDLLDEYLRVTGKRLVWIIWGERWLLPEDMFRIRPCPLDIQTAKDKNLHLHKRLIVYPSNKG